MEKLIEEFLNKYVEDQKKLIFDNKNHLEDSKTINLIKKSYKNLEGKSPNKKNEKNVLSENSKYSGFTIKELNGNFLKEKDISKKKKIYLAIKDKLEKIDVTQSTKKKILEKLFSEIKK